MRSGWRRVRSVVQSPDLRDAREADVRGVGLALGLAMPPGRRRSGRCPLPDHVDRDPSFWISPDGRRWKCFGCQRSGDALDLVRAARSCDLPAALEHFRDWRGSSAIALARVPAGPAVFEWPEPDPNVYARLLELSPLSERGRDYLASRAIAARVVEMSRVGEIAADRGAFDLLRREFGEDRLDSAGLLGGEPGGPRRPLFRGPALLFPFQEDGVPVALQARSLGGADARWMGLRGQRKRAYRLLGEDRMRGVWICEGVTDALTAAGLGHDALGMLGADAGLDDATLALLRGRDVYVVGDNDDRGRSFARRLLRLLSTHGIAADEFRVPTPFKDLNDWSMCFRG
ncbi:CHC2 zinc finger domain-containing protein [Sphingomonas endophytica]|uniref:CHC2 zinc finger domain-containing protein n=1 Tax=Sphingomonas endophytica TaxID=869719 RepID=UPI0009FA9F12|nr:CHC2 zinc finger domain-containing protein [Sphingomonas endophytica]